MRKRTTTTRKWKAERQQRQQQQINIHTPQDTNKTKIKRRNDESKSLIKSLISQSNYLVVVCS